jgi:putative nucleotidyltransferase with HDIG domain
MEKMPVQVKALVVDDESKICEILAALLAHAGFDCQTCSSGKQALEAASQQHYDVIISDLQMPGMTGLELLKEVRARHPHLAFVMATGVNDINIGIQAMKEGADDYVLKPFQLNAVVPTVERALDKKRLELLVENYRQNLEQLVKDRTKQLQVAMKRIELTYDETLEALGAALDLRDNETAGHSLRVTRYCLEMAEAAGQSAEQLKHIERGALLHDIGKIGIPDAILLKPGKLTEAETAVMQTHARIGYNLVCRIAFLAPAAEIVLTHQERFDGTGYPQGLYGNEIPLGARIFSLADTLDAMTSDRPYRKALPFSEAKEEIARGSGRQFDPEVVKVFLSFADHDWERIRLDFTTSPRIKWPILQDGAELEAGTPG